MYIKHTNKSHPQGADLAQLFRVPEIREHESPDHYLARVLAKLFPLSWKDDGLEDEQFKILKDNRNGNTIWRQGDTKVSTVDGTFEIITS